MHHVIKDEYDDSIVVAPMRGNGLYPRVMVRFIDEDEEQIDMVLSERQVRDLKRVLTMTIKRAEVAG